ncbi:MAG: M67 family metallopeptidase [Thermoplasmata archaeon]
MNGLAISSDLVDSMRDFARTAYPEECCGFLLSPDTSTGGEETRTIVAVVPARNRSEAERQRRFVILPDELRAAERDAAAHSRLVSGFYHSHPDHPARPSVFDQEHAWPWYAYLILASTRNSTPSSIGAFELDPDLREFRAIDLTVVPAPIPSGGSPAP